MSINRFGDSPSKGSYPPTLRRLPSPAGGFICRHKRDSRMSSAPESAKLNLKIRIHETNQIESRFRSKFEDDYMDSTSLVNVDSKKSKLNISQYNERASSIMSTNDLPRMNSSFVFRKDPSVVAETKEIASETISGLLRRNFGSWKDYNDWAQNDVEHFINKLKKAILNSKPEHLEEFVIGYCCREAMGQPHPTLPTIKSAKGDYTLTVSIPHAKSSRRASVA